MAKSFQVPVIPRTMRAVVYRGPNDLRVETVPVPRIGPHELLVKVAACGVCPTDIKKIQYGTVPPPRIFGHETAGTIVRIGTVSSRRSQPFKVGDRVALHHHVPCLECHSCRHHAYAQCEQYKRTGITAGFEPAGGGYAEYVRVMPFVLPGVVKIPDRTTFLEGAMLEPVNTVLKAVKRLALLRGDTVLVAGQGPIGLMFTRLLALAGMKVIATDLLETRLDLAQEFGATAACRPGDPHAKASGKEKPTFPSPQPSPSGREGSNRARSAKPEPLEKSNVVLCSSLSPGERGTLPPELARDKPLLSVVERLTQGRGLDAAVIAVPSDAVVREAQSLLRGGGQLMLFAHTRRGVETPLDLATVCVDEKDMIGSYSSDFRLQSEVARLVFSRKLDARRLITHEFPLEETAKAIELAARPTAESLKIVVSQP